MKYLVSLYIWVAGFLTFSLIVLVNLFLTFIFPLRKLERFFRNSYKMLFKVLFIKVKVTYKEPLPKGQAMVFMSNHQSLFDAPLMAAYLPVYMRGIEAESHFKWPIFGYYLKRHGNIPINRDNVRSSLKSMDKAADYLKDGISIIIFPEGHRTLTGDIQAFKKLPFMLAKKAGVPIVPIGIDGLYQLKRKNSWVVRHSSVKMNFGTVVPVEKVLSSKPEELMELVFNEVCMLKEQ